MRAHRTVAGTIDAHRFVVRAPYLDRELVIAREMGYTAEAGPCLKAECLGLEPTAASE